MMLHDRVVELERAHDELRREHDVVMRRMERLERLEYFADRDCFKPAGGGIDWFVWEPVETAHVSFQTRLPEPMTAAHLDAQVVLPYLSGRQTDHANVRMPVQRHCDVYRVLRISKGLTVRELLAAIHAFYDTPVTASDLAEHDDIGAGDDYVTEARIALREGRRVTWLDLIGTRRVPPTSGRRDWCECSGLVRFEGIRAKEDRYIELSLGS